MTRGVFHRQGPFVGSGGLYSPGPATALVTALASDVATAERRSHVVLGLSRSFHVFQYVKADSPAFSSRGASTDVLTPMTAPC